LFSLAGSFAAEAYQIIYAGAFTCLGIYYLLMFAVPLIAGTRFGHQPDLRPGRFLRVGCVTAMIIIAGAIGFNAFPLVAVGSKFLFAAKIFGTALVLNLLAALVYHRGKRRALAAGLSEIYDGEPILPGSR